MRLKNSSKGFCYRTLKLFTIFLFIGLLSLNFAYSTDNNGVTFKIVDVNILKYTNFNNYNYHKFNYADYRFTIPDNILNAIKTVHDNSAWFTDTHFVLDDYCDNSNGFPCHFDGYNSSAIDNNGNFWIRLNQLLHNPYNNDVYYTITKSPEHLICSKDADTLTCSNPEKYFGTDTMTIQVTDIGWKLNSSATFDIFVKQNIVMPTFTQSVVSQTINQDSVLSIQLQNYVNNPNSISYSINVKPSSNLKHGNCQVTTTVPYIANCNFNSGFYGQDTVTFFIPESNSEITFNLNVLAVNHQPTLNSLKLTNGSILVSISGTNSTTINLKDYVLDSDLNSNYTYKISGTQDVATCSIAGDNLICSPKSLGEANIVVVLTDDTFTLNLPIHIVVTNYNTIPILDSSKLTNGKIAMNIDDGKTTTLNLKDYVIDPDSVKAYTYSNPSSSIATCSIVSDVLSCTGTKNGEQTINIVLTDGQYTLNLPIDITVTQHDEPPQYLNNFVDKGITVFDANPNFTIDLSQYFSDSDNPINPSDNTSGTPLVYGLNKVTGSATVTCSGFGTLTCSVSGATGFADIQFYATDGKYTATITPLYHVSIVKATDFSPTITGPMKVLNGQSFDMIYNLKNNLGFTLYKLPVTFDISSNYNLDANFYNADGTLDGHYFYTDLAPQDSPLIKIKVTTPDISTPQTYIITPKLDGVASYLQTTITSIPYNATYLKDYFSVILDTPGQRSDGKNNYLPAGVKTIIPFKINNGLDVPISLYICKVATGSGVILYSDDGSNIANGNFCSFIQMMPGSTEDKIIAKTTDATTLYVPYLFFDLTNVSLSDNTIYSYTNYKNNSLSYILGSATNQFYFDNGDYLNSEIITPTSGTTLNKNQQYQVAVNLSNYYAYSLLDVNSCVYIKKTVSTTEYYYLLDSDVYTIIGNNCGLVQLNYANATQFGTGTVNYSILTKGLIYQSGGVSPWYKLDSGFNINSTYVHKAYGSYNIT